MVRISTHLGWAAGWTQCWTQCWTYCRGKCWRLTSNENYRHIRSVASKQPTIIAFTAVECPAYLRTFVVGLNVGFVVGESVGAYDTI